ncbi:MAG: hypothetical protein U1E73_04185 [Planctomycetota bacterium]
MLCHLVPPVAALLLATAATTQNAVALRSGTVPAGQLEPAITYLRGPSTSGFGAAFTAADFQGARTGVQALVRPSLAGWQLQLPQDPFAQWIDTQGGSASALYAIPFTMSTTAASAVLRLQFAVDDYLGEPAIEGAYVNEIPLAGSANIGSYYYAADYQNGDVLPLLQPGQNWLYLYARNTGGAGGLLFSAELVLDGGMIRRFGSGCAGSNGTPLYLVAATSTAPGTTIDLRLYNLPTAPAPVVFLFGIDGTMCFGMPTPVDLALFGYAGCNCLLEPMANVFGLNTAGAANLTMTLPGPGFVGRSLFSQAFVLDPAAARGASVSGGIELRSGS